jgi:6-pyruvoyltetrahydropterin/6-carboxytetrahydropterin synthase
MKIEKKYHFYAAHRNKEAGKKCGRIHGHTYHVTCIFDFEYRDSICMLFSDIDAIVEPIIKAYDHHLILCSNDSLCDILNKADEPFIELPFPTSAENMACHLFNRIKDAGMNIVRVELAETQTSKVIYEPTIGQ